MVVGSQLAEAGRSGGVGLAAATGLRNPAVGYESKWVFAGGENAGASDLSLVSGYLSCGVCVCVGVFGESEFLELLRRQNLGVDIQCTEQTLKLDKLGGGLGSQLGV